MARGFGGRGFWGPGYGVWGGNPYPFCRRFPWLPRGWWATTPYSPYYAEALPGYVGAGYPSYYGRGLGSPYYR